MNDSQIIDLYWARDPEAIAQTDAVYGRRLHVLSNRILHSREDAEESVNDTYLRIWKAIPPARPRYFFAFLAAVCRHISLNRLDWKNAAKRNAEIVSLSQEMELCIPDIRRQQELEGKELGKLLDTFLETLPNETRLIFLRRYWYMDSIGDIAARYSMTESKVKMQLHRTRGKLRRYLKKEGVTV